MACASRCVCTLLLVPLLAAPFAACSSDEEKREGHVAAADEFLAAGKTSEALIELRSALQLDPQNANLNLRIGQALEYAGALQDALFFYQEAVRLAPEDGSAALAAARLLMFEDPDKAEQLIAGVVARNPGDAIAYLRRSELALVRGKTQEALEDARTAVEKAPNNHMTFFQEGVVHRARIRERRLLGQGDDPKLFEEALAAFDEGLEVAAPDAPVHEVVRGALERALTFAAWKERQAEAGPAFRRAVEIAKQRGSVPEELRALGETREYAQAAGEVELERWVLETQIALDTHQYAAWARLAVLTGDDSVLKRLIETLPDDARAHALYARLLWERGREDDALEHLRSTETKVDDPVPIRMVMVELFVEHRRFDDAREIVGKLEKEYADRPETADAASLLAIRERRFDEAIALLEKLNERRESSRTRMRLAEAQFRVGNLQAALVAVNRALEISVESDDVIAMLRLKGRVEAAAGDRQAAVATFRRVRNEVGGIPPDDVPVLARVLYETNREEGARAILNEALAANDPPLEVTLIYLAREGARDPVRAREVLARAAERHPNQPALLGHLVRGDLAEGHPERAEQRMAAAVAALPKNPALRRLQAQALIANHKPEEALSAAEQALQLAPEMPGVPELVVGLLTELGRREEAVTRLEKEAKQGGLGVSGRILLARLQILAGRDDSAIALLEGVLAERSDLPGAKNDLAFLLARKGSDFERARRLAEEARAALPRSAEVADTLGYVYMKAGLLEPAADQFRAAIELAREQTEIWATSQYHLGLSYKALGRLPEARQAFERALATAVEFPEAEDARKEAEGIPATAEAS